MRLTLHCVVLVTASALAFPVAAQWSNAGGNAGRNGRTSEIGPDDATTIWTNAPSSIIAWQPVIEDRRVYVVRQTGFPPEPNSDESPIYCLDLDTGDIIWRVDIPFSSGNWTTWIAGVQNGKVFAARSGNGATSIAQLRCYDALTGDFLWASTDTITAGAYDGVVFAPNGDPIVADFRNITRFEAQTGSTVWRVDRLCSVSGNCGGALSQDGVYIADVVPGGDVIKKFDIDTGAFKYESTLMPGFTLQNSPMVAPDGTVFLPRTQNNPVTDFLYAFEDSGSSLSVRWNVPTQWSTSTELAVGPDGSVYHLAPGRFLTRLDSATGTTLDQNATPIDFDGSGIAPRMATDQFGRVFLTNGAFANGRVYSFDADLTLRWSAPITNVNIGGPAIGPDGTLVIAGNGTNVRAYRTPRCLADTNHDGILTPADFTAWIAAFNSQSPECDQNGDGSCTPADFTAWIANYNDGCN